MRSVPHVSGGAVTSLSFGAGVPRSRERIRAFIHRKRGQRAPVGAGVSPTPRSAYDVDVRRRLDCGDSGAGERPEKSATIGHQRPRKDLVFEVRRVWPERKPRKRLT
ncbi:hypothetical protein MRX96_015107 [Rhipicephalus microplus]